jgi:hypothetical protein
MAMAECPICKSKAEPLDVVGDYRGFDCPKHGKFKVADTIFALPDFVNSDAALWEAVLRLAQTRAKPGEWPTIGSYEFLK